MEHVMTDREIKEKLQLMGYGETPPKRLLDIIGVFRKRKGIYAPVPIEDADLVTCTMIYDITNAKKHKEKQQDG